MSLEGAIAFLVSEVGSITGINAAPAQPPESSGAFPFLIVYPASGDYITEFAYEYRALHTINLEVHFNRSNLPSTINILTPMIQEIADVLVVNPTLGDTVDTIVASDNRPYRYVVLSVEYAGVQTLAVRFQLTVKITGSNMPT